MDVLVHPEDNWKALCKVGADNKRNLCASDSTEDGDVDAVLADCDEVVEGTYHVRAAQQAMMETFRTTCFMDAYGRLNILSSTQIVYHVRRIISNALGIEKNRVNVKATTEEGLGFTGQKEGISSQAICSISSMYEHMSSDMAAPQTGCNGCSGCRRV